MKWRALMVVAALFCVAALVVYIAGTQTHPAIPTTSSAIAQKTVEINGHTVDIEVADTPAAREKGLGQRDSLAADHGMLFAFENEGDYAFWMKDMRFSIDIIWLSAQGRVVSISENISPDTYPQTFSSKNPAKYVLELPANSVKSYNMRVGDIVRL